MTRPLRRTQWTKYDALKLRESNAKSQLVETPSSCCRNDGLTTSVDDAPVPIARIPGHCGAGVRLFTLACVQYSCGTRPAQLYSDLGQNAFMCFSGAPLGNLETKQEQTQLNTTNQTYLKKNIQNTQPRTLSKNQQNQKKKTFL